MKEVLPARARVASVLLLGLAHSCTSPRQDFLQNEIVRVEVTRESRDGVDEVVLFHVSRANLETAGISERDIQAFGTSLIDEIGAVIGSAAVEAFTGDLTTHPPGRLSEDFPWSFAVFRDGIDMELLRIGPGDQRSAERGTIAWGKPK